MLGKKYRTIPALLSALAFKRASGTSCIAISKLLYTRMFLFVVHCSAALAAMAFQESPDTVARILKAAFGDACERTLQMAALSAIRAVASAGKQVVV